MISIESENSRNSRRAHMENFAEDSTDDEHVADVGYNREKVIVQMDRYQRSLETSLFAALRAVEIAKLELTRL